MDPRWETLEAVLIAHEAHGPVGLECPTPARVLEVGPGRPEVRPHDARVGEDGPRQEVGKVAGVADVVVRAVVEGVAAGVTLPDTGPVCSLHRRPTHRKHLEKSVSLPGPSAHVVLLDSGRL